jgi:uncharacterized protein YbjT (DUF2867 family)
MKIALIGATGFIGSALRQEALARGHHVTALVGHPEKLAAAPNLQGVQADVHDTARLAETLKGHDVVVSAFSGHAQGDVEGYYLRNIAFHDTIYRSSHNHYLVEVTLSVRNRLAPFRKLQFEGIGRLAHSLAEHDGIVQAIFRGDGEGAAALMRRHMQLVRTSVGEVSPSLRGGGTEAAAGETARGLAEPGSAPRPVQRAV